MPKKVFQLPVFNKGIISTPPARDIDRSALSFSDNVDSKAQGKIRGIKGETSVNTSYDPRVMESLIGENNELIGQDSSKQFKFYDIDGDSITNIGSVTGDFAKSLVTKNRETYAAMTTLFRGSTPGTPKWIGHVNEPVFGVGAAGFKIADSELKNFSDTQTFDSSKSNDTPFISVGDCPGGTNSDAAVQGTDASDAFFLDDNTYYYAVSIVYDGYQESPLIFGYDDGDDLWQITTSTGSGFNSVESLHINLRIGFDEGELPERVTGFKLYRAQSPSSESVPTSEYKLVKYFDDPNVDSNVEEWVDFDVETAAQISSGDTTFDTTKSGRYQQSVDVGDNIRVGDNVERRVTGISGSTITVDEQFDTTINSGVTVYFGFDTWYENNGDVGYPGSPYAPDNTFHIWYEDKGSDGASYEDNTGVSETLESTSVDYSINADYGGYMFVGGASHPDIPDANQYVFRSKPKTYSIIDWTNDFAILPEKPVALQGFNGFIYAFGGSNTYRININTLSVDDTFRGVGALNENCAISTNFGMFHADESNIYFNDGRASKPIGTPILEMDGKGWEECVKTDASSEQYASLAFDPKNKRLLCFVSVSSGNTACWAYDVEFQRWDFYDGYDVPTDTAVGPDGDVYASIGDTTSGFDLKSLFTNSTRKQWIIETKDFVLDSDSGFFWVYDIQGYGSGDFTIKYFINGSSTENDNSTSTSNELRKTTVAGSDKKVRSIKVKAEAAAASDELDNMTIQFRPPVIQQ